MKNQAPTYKKFNSDYKEILDLVICTPTLIPFMDKIAVFDEYSMCSDHFPMLIKYNIRPDSEEPINKNKKNTIFNYNKADWEGFKQSLSAKNIDPSQINPDLDFLVKFVADSIIDAANKFVPKIQTKPFKKSFPSDLVNLILERKTARKKAVKSGLIEDKAAFNKLTLKIRIRKIDLKSKEWDEFLLKQGPNPTSSRPFWKKINKVLKGPQNSKIPKLLCEGKEFSTDSEKAEIFMKMLSKTFSGSHCVLNNNSSQLEANFVTNEFLSSRENLKFEKVTISELKSAIKSIPVSSAPGSDRIENIMLKNIPNNFFYILLAIINQSLEESYFPKIWKSAEIVMISKTTEEKNNPNNYRPISLLSCLGKLVERVVKSRLYNYFEKM